MIKKLVQLIYLLVWAGTLQAQDSTALVSYEIHMEQASRYNEFRLFTECVDEINLALEIAKEQDWKEKEISASITLAEIKRRSQDYEEGLSILRELKGSENFPHLHVRKMGRMAALFNEKSGSINNSDYLKDSVLIYLKQAIRSAINLNLTAEQAGLYNELGYTLGNSHIDSSIHYLKKASELYKNLLDTPNYIGSQINILRIHARQGNREEAEKIIDEILEISSHNVEGGINLWLEFYGTITFYYKSIGDTVQLNRWNIEKYKKESEHYKNVGSLRLNSFRALYETQKYQDEVDKKAAELSEETAKKKRLIISLVILGILILGIAFLLFRERKLKQEVNKSNEKYHMLIVESNHRIKNNLQMVISMLEYANKDLGDSDSIAFKRMSGKIQTISALHKHLYLDVHNEKVDLNSYFNDIIALYEGITAKSFTIKKKIVPVSIQSERIVYFGLIFNEMLANTFEHSNAIKKEILISVEDREDRFRLSYQDFSSFETRMKKGTGLTLIEQLVKRVEGSKFQLNSSTGLYQFEFYV